MAAVFKKKSGPKRRCARRPATDDDEEDEGSQVLASLRAEQRERRRGAGIAPEKLALRSSALAATSAGEAATEETSTADADGKAARPKGLSMAQFTGTSTSEVTVEMQHESLMNAFIEKKLGVRKDAKAAASEIETEDDRLYVLPAHLRATAAGASGNRSAATTGEASGAAAETEGLGGPLAWGSGIAEVALPVEEKRRNIEATEQAIRALKAMQEREEADPLALRSEDGNVSVNFGKHRRDYAAELRKLAERRAKAKAELEAEQAEVSHAYVKPEAGTKRSRKGPQPTDERAFRHFKKTNRM